MEIKSIDNLLRYIYELNPVSGNYCFRGQSESSWQIIPSIHRIKPKPLKRYQTVILEAFLLYLFSYKKIKKTHLYTNHEVEFLAMCQHYGVPTRLLDWSNDILVSLYFACENNLNLDGSFIICDKTKFKSFNFNDFRTNIVEPQIVNTHLVNPRLRSQSGCFMLWGNIQLNNKSSESYHLEEYCNEKFTTSPLIKLSIPKHFKNIILEELYWKYGINHDSIYLNNIFSEFVENEYKVFKFIADIITNDFTNTTNLSKLSPFTGNFAGCENLRSLPKEPMREFYPIVDSIIAHLPKN
ncbi:FRG domain-containing protein [Aquiflexum sp.]|uniref:FRG domain-containing protein n=1 Tax=Aquiflexum sp. TaxID=1872584 RepID=UPI003593BBD4